MQPFYNPYTGFQPHTQPLPHPQIKTDPLRDALFERCTFYQFDGQQVQPHLHPAWAMTDHLWKVQTTIDHLVKTQATPFSIKSQRDGFRYLTATEPGEKFRNLLQTFPETIRQHFPDHQFHPYIDLYLEQIEKRHLVGHNSGPPSSLLYPSSAIQQWVDTANECVRAIRKKTSTAQFKEKLKEHNKSESTNFRRLNHVFKEYTQRNYSLPNLWRFDFSYQPHTSTSTSLTEEKNQAQKDIAHLLKHIKKNFSTELFFLAWRINLLPINIVVCHLLLIPANNRKINKEILFDNLYKYWWQEITQKRGVAFDLQNPLPFSRPWVTLNHLCHPPEHNYAALYMTKPDLTVTSKQKRLVQEFFGEECFYK